MTRRHPSHAPPDSAGRPAYQQQIHAGPGGTVYAVLHGDMHITGEHAVYRFEPFPSLSRPVGTEGTYRDEEMATMAAWRDDPAEGISVLLAHGPGGHGESRLAARFAVDSAESGWTVWAAYRASDSTAHTAIAPGNPGRTLVIIAEDVERWPTDDLQLLAQGPLLRLPARARVLLMAQEAGTWWLALRHRLGKAGITAGGTLALRNPSPGVRSGTGDSPEPPEA